MAHVAGLRAVALAVNIGTSLLTASLLGPSGRGELSALVLAPTFLGGVASLGLHASLIYNLKAHPAEARASLGNGILLTFCLGVLGALAGWVLEPYWLSHYSRHTVQVGRLLLLVTPLIVVQWSLTGAAEVQGWFGLGNRLLYMQSLLTLAALGLLAWQHLLTPVTAALAYVLPMVPAFATIFVIVLVRLRPLFRPSRAHVAKLLHFGVRFCGIDLLATVAGTLDQTVIVAFLSPHTVGNYVVAVSSARVLTVVQTGIITVLFPSIAAGSAADVSGTVAGTFRIATMLNAGLAAGLALVGPTLLMLAYGPRFHDCILPFRLLLAGMVLENGARILYQWYAAAGRPGIVTFFEVGAVTTSVLLMLLLVPLIGPAGAACAMVGASCFRLGVAAAGLHLVLDGRKRPRLLPDHRDVLSVWTGLFGPGDRVPAAPAVVAGLETGT